MPVDPHLFPYWRVWLKNQRGGERYVDVTGAGYGFLRAANGIKDRGEWIDRWQPLIVPTLGNRYPLRHRLRVAWRSWRRSRAR